MDFPGSVLVRQIISTNTISSLDMKSEVLSMISMETNNDLKSLEIPSIHTNEEIKEIMIGYLIVIEFKDAEFPFLQFIPDEQGAMKLYNSEFKDEEKREMHQPEIYRALFHQGQIIKEAGRSSGNFKVLYSRYLNSTNSKAEKTDT